MHAGFRKIHIGVPSDKSDRQSGSLVSFLKSKYNQREFVRNGVMINKKNKGCLSWGDLDLINVNMSNPYSLKPKTTISSIVKHPLRPDH